MLPKTGIVLPKGETPVLYVAIIATALQKQLGTTHQAVKTVMRWTGAGERSVKNWLGGISGPSGQYLIALIHHSDAVLEALLAASGRQGVAATIKLDEVRTKIAEILTDLDATFEMNKCSPTPTQNPVHSNPRPT
jgi:hypothetical protein